MDKFTPIGSSTTIKPELGQAEDDERFREFHNDPNVPQDAKVIAGLLRSSGIPDYDPKVINQILDFMHRTYLSPRRLRTIAERAVWPWISTNPPKPLNFMFNGTIGYLTDLIMDAEDLRAHAGKPAIDVEDIRLSTHTRITHSFIQPLSRQVRLQFHRFLTYQLIVYQISH